MNETVNKTKVWYKRWYMLVIVYPLIVGLIILMVEILVSKRDNSSKSFEFNTASYGQLGGVTAGVYNDYSTKDLPAPKVSFDTVSTNVPIDGKFKSTFSLKVDSRVPVSEVFMEISARSLFTDWGVEVIPASGNGTVSKHFSSTNKIGIYKLTIRDAKGDYNIHITTGHEEYNILKIISYNN